MGKKPFYITTAIAYTSKTPHIGNTYEAVLADSIARFKRLEGFDVFFLTGTDEHGQKIQQQAEEEGITPKEHVDKIAAEVREIWDFMGTSYDKFIRTTDDYHEEIVQKIFKKLYDQGDIYKGSYKGWYCTPCESFFTESQLNSEKICPDCGSGLENTNEEAYFFKLSKYADRLMKHIEANPDFIQPESRKNEMVNNFLKPGLQDLCVSRTSFDWGIPVSFDNKHVIYVWVDALSNYITGLGYNPEGESHDLFNKYWPADVHLIGKDILRFHTIYWPIMLMALGVPLPKKIFGHPWLMVGEDKMSKSKGNVIYAKELVDHFGVDPIRYYVLHEMPFAQDGTLTYELLISRINSDLANILGNLVNRTVAMVEKYFDGIIPEQNQIEDMDKDLINTALNLKNKIVVKMNDLKVADAIGEIWSLLRRSNKYIDETFPWILAKDESQKDRLGTVLYNLLESIRISSILLSPFMPETSRKIQEQINAKNLDWDSLDNFNGTISGTKVGKAEGLFQRIDEKKKLEEIFKGQEDVKEEPSKKEPAKESKEELVNEISNEISIEDFSKVNIVVGKVIFSEKAKGSDKLLVSKIQIGKETKQIVSGIAKYYEPEDFIGKKVLVVTNLKPIKLRGILSEGMILAATDDEGNLSLATIDKDLKEGSIIG